VAHRAHPADVIVLAPVPIDTLLNRRSLAPGDLFENLLIGHAFLTREISSREKGSLFPSCRLLGHGRG